MWAIHIARYKGKEGSFPSQDMHGQQNQYWMFRLCGSIILSGRECNSAAKDMFFVQEIIPFLVNKILGQQMLGKISLPDIPEEPLLVKADNIKLDRPMV